MTNFIVKTGIAALIALTGFAGTATVAAAQGPEFGIYIQHRGGWDGDRHRDRDRWDGPRHHQRGGRCSPRLAEEKARHMGLRRARVVDVDRRTVTVVGRDRRGRDRIVFANDRGCPVIRR
jgi:hypothetical protein